MLGPPVGITFSMTPPHARPTLLSHCDSADGVVAFRVSCCNEQRTDVVGTSFLEQRALSHTLIRKSRDDIRFDSNNSYIATIVAVSVKLLETYPPGLHTTHNVESVLLRCDAASLDMPYPTFRINTLPSSSRTFKGLEVRDSRPFSTIVD